MTMIGTGPRPTAKWCAFSLALLFLLKLVVAHAENAYLDPLAPAIATSKAQMDQALEASGPTSSEYKEAVRSYGQIRLAQALGKFESHNEEAAAILGETLNLMREVLGLNDSDTQGIQVMYGSFLAAMGQADEGLRLITQSAESASQPAKPGDNLQSDGHSAPHNTTNDEGLRIDALQAKGDEQFDDAQWLPAYTTYKELLNFKLKIYDEDDYRTVQTLVDLARVCLHLGQNTEAIDILRRADKVYDTFSGWDVVHLSTRRLLGQALVRTGRLREAESVQRAALTLNPTDINSNQSIGFANIELGDNLQRQGRHAEALRYYVAGFEIIGSQLFKPTVVGENGTLGRLQLEIANALYDVGRTEEAKPYYWFAMQHVEGIYTEKGCANSGMADAMFNIAVRYPGANKIPSALLQLKCLIQNSPNWPRAYFYLGALQELNGQPDQAMIAFEKSLRLEKGWTGSDSPSSALVGERLAKLQLGAGQYQAALATARDALATRRLVSKREIEGAPGEAEAEVIGQRANAATLFVRAALTLKAKNQSSPTLAVETFAAAQSMANTDAGRALSRGAVKASLDAKGVALATAWEDQLAQRFARDLHDSESMAYLVQDPTALAKYAEENTALARTEAELKSHYPSYFQMVAPDPVSLDELQHGVAGKTALLHSNEALIVLTPGNQMLPINQRRGLVFAVTTEGVAWGELGLEPDVLNAEIARLRATLDPSGGQVPNFDRALARRLHDSLFANPSVAKLISGKEEWLISPQGSLLSLPFAALVTGSYGGSDDKADDLRATPWLGIAHALTIVPEVSSLKVLRGLPRPARPARTTFFGIGDPDFKRGAGEGPINVLKSPASSPSIDPSLPFRWSPEELATVFEYFNSETGMASPKALAPISADGVGPVTRYLRSGEADVEAIRQLRPLPGTRAEILDLATILSAGPDSMLLGDQATEENLRQHNLNGDLFRSRVLAFSTHGLLAGDFSGSLNQAALVLAPPRSGDKVQGAENDGLLTASEAASLKLNSDWVILSACNTASGGQPNAEGLAGLARAFFYAGADSLLVSHWRIADDSAGRLTTRAIQLQQIDRRLSRAKALQRAMLELMDETVRDESGVGLAHPTFWAAFELVGAER